MDREGAGSSGERGNCSWDVLYVRRIKRKIPSPFTEDKVIRTGLLV